MWVFFNFIILVNMNRLDDYETPPDQMLPPPKLPSPPRRHRFGNRQKYETEASSNLCEFDYVESIACNYKSPAFKKKLLPRRLCFDTVDLESSDVYDDGKFLLFKR